MGINETGKIDFAKYVNNDNFKDAKVTKESKFVANVFGEAVKTRAIASNEIKMDGKLSVAEKDVLKNAVKNNVIQGLSAKELTDLPDSELEQFAQYIDDLSNNKVPAKTKQDLSALAETNKGLQAKLDKMQASMDSVINVKDNEIKALNDKFSVQETELNKIKAAEQKKAEAAKKQQAANSAVLNKTMEDYAYRKWSENDNKRDDKIEEKFAHANINYRNIYYSGKIDKPDFKFDLMEAITNDPIIMKRLSSASTNLYVDDNHISIYTGNPINYSTGVDLEEGVKIKDMLKELQTISLH